jgi:drug/metabolite transporter (DMT)-like permease
MTDRSQHTEHLVQPRRVWGGLALALAGAALIGLGVALESWPWAIVGIVVLLAGAGLGLRGGVLYDVHRQHPGREVEQVAHGDVHRGVAPGEMVHDPRVRRTSREMDAQREALVRRTHEAPRPPMAQLGAIVVLVVSVFLLFAQWEVYPPGRTPQTNAVWSLGFAILAGLAALRILLGQPSRHLAASLLILLSGVGLLLRAFLADHVIDATAIAEGVSGALVLLGGVAALVSPDRGDRAG